MAGSYVLVSLDPPFAEREVGEGGLRLGRAADNDLVVVDRAVNKHHAVLARDASGRIVLRDLGTMNGTFVNGEPIVERVLAERDELRLGLARFRVEWRAPAPESPPRIVASLIARGARVVSQSDTECVLEMGGSTITASTLGQFAAPAVTYFLGGDRPRAACDAIAAGVAGALPGGATSAAHDTAWVAQVTRAAGLVVEGDAFRDSRAGAYVTRTDDALYFCVSQEAWITPHTRGTAEALYAIVRTTELPSEVDAAARVVASVASIAAHVGAFDPAMCRFCGASFPPVEFHGHLGACHRCAERELGVVH